MSRALPDRPNLMHLRREAKALLKAHHRGDAAACEVLRLHPSFAGKSDDGILAAPIGLQVGQHALALSYGFESWAELKRHVDSTAAAATSRAVIHGRITSEETGEPVADAEVRAGVALGIRLTTPTLARTQSGADGHYSLIVEWPGDEPKLLVLEVRARGHELFSWVSPSESVDGDEVVADAALRDGFAVDLIVTDPDGKPLGDVEADASVGSDELDFAKSLPQYRVVDADGRDTKTDADGRLTLHGFSPRMLDATERFVIMLHHPRYVDCAIQDIHLGRRPRGGAVTIRARLQRGGVLTGRVTAAGSGEGLADVQIVSRIRAESSVQFRAVHTAKETLTDADGRYEIHGVGVEAVSVRARHPHWLEKQREVDVVGEQTVWDVVLEHGPAVRGRVIGSDGEPLRGVRVRADWRRDQGAGEQFFRMIAHTDEQGAFMFRCVPAGHPIDIEARQVNDPHPPLICGVCTVEADGDEIIFDVRQHTTLSGHLVDASTSEPVAGKVICVAWRTPGWLYAGSSPLGPPDGSFNITIPPGQAVLAAQVAGEWYGLIEIDARPGEVREGIAISGERACEVGVQVTDSETDKPVVGAQVHVRPSMPPWTSDFSTPTNSEGLAIIAGIPRGTANIRIVANGYESIDVPRVDVSEDAREPVVVKMQPRVAGAQRS